MPQLFLQQVFKGGESLSEAIDDESSTDEETSGFH